MQTYEIETLPCVKFAHVYHANTYFNTFLKKEDSMEITLPIGFQNKTSQNQGCQ